MAIEDKCDLPNELALVRENALRAIGAIKPTDNNTQADKEFLFNAQRTITGQILPAPYLVYFLFVELLGFNTNVKFEKTAWSVTIDYKGIAYLIEHRKFGLGIFSHDAESQKTQAKEIVNLIQKSLKAANPFFEYKASEAVKNPSLNVVNHSLELYGRYKFLLSEYEKKYQEAIDRRDECVINKLSDLSATFSYPARKLRNESKWLAQAAIEAFFSWTEHIFIHIAILERQLLTGAEVDNLANQNWTEKFKKALDINDNVTKKHLDALISIRRQSRNFVAHGSFGKQGEAFSFHSAAGAVPVLLKHQNIVNPFTLSGEIDLDEDIAINSIKAFIDHLWTDNREPLRLYIQESNLPLILPMASDGTYEKAMSSTQNMENLIDKLNYHFDKSANMDF